MHVDSKSLHYDMGAICSCSPTVSHTHAHICSGNKQQEHTPALPDCVTSWRKRTEHLSNGISQGPWENYNTVQSEGETHTHTYTKVEYRKEKAWQVRLEMDLMISLDGLCACSDGFRGWHSVVWVCSHYRHTHIVSSCDVQCYMAPIRLIISGVCPLLLCH